VIVKYSVALYGVSAQGDITASGISVWKDNRPVLMPLHQHASFTMEWFVIKWMVSPWALFPTDYGFLLPDTF
jgi:hypothetical protein